MHKTWPVTVNIAERQIFIEIRTVFSCYPHISAITLFRGQTVLGVFLDSETNGLNFQKHRVVEIAFKIVDVLSGGVLGHL